MNRHLNSRDEAGLQGRVCDLPARCNQRIQADLSDRARVRGKRLLDISDKEEHSYGDRSPARREKRGAQKLAPLEVPAGPIGQARPIQTTWANDDSQLELP